MKTLKTQTFHLLLLLLLLRGAHGAQPDCDNAFGPDGGDTLRIMHIFHPCSPFRPPTPLSWEDTVLRMQADDSARLQLLSALVATHRAVVPIAPGQLLIQRPNYIIRAPFGTPSQPMYVAIDTGNDVSWIPCSGCVGCSGPTAFAPRRSATFHRLSCRAPHCKLVPNFSCGGGGGACAYSFTYGRSNISTTMSEDALALAGDRVASFKFGCVERATGSSVLPQGLLGMGRGPLSVLAQTQDLYASVFSYCLPSFKSLNFTGSLRLGPKFQPIRIHTTPLLRSLRRPSLYYVELVAIRVGRRVVAIPPAALAFNAATGAGTVFDSGTVFTRLVTAAYLAVRDAFRARVGRGRAVTSLGGFDTCYAGPVVAPTITFMFRGMNLTLPPENLLIHSSAGSTACLAMAAAPDDGYNSALNVIANMQQQNHRVLYDGVGSRLGVSREFCS